VSVTFSVPTLDDEVWRKTGPSTAHPRQRLRVLKELVDAGVKAGVGMAPILPGLSDRPEQLREVVAAAREAGATGVWTNLLYLRAGTKEHFLEALASDWPAELERYEELYRGRAYLPARYAAPVKEEVARLRLESGAKGYILKEAPHQTLVTAIERVAASDGYVDPALMPGILAGKDKDDMLTAREREILQLLADGMSNADAAKKLFISQETVKSHVRHILTKLEADTRTHAVAIALREAIID